jgi:hypothetical protein
LKEDANNYPITLVPALSKIVGKVITNSYFILYTNTRYLINLNSDLGKINPKKMLLPQLLKI